MDDRIFHRAHTIVSDDDWREVMNHVLARFLETVGGSADVVRSTLDDSFYSWVAISFGAGALSVSWRGIMTGAHRPGEPSLDIDAALFPHWRNTRIGPPGTRQFVYCHYQAGPDGVAAWDVQGRLADVHHEYAEYDTADDLEDDDEDSGHADP